MKDHLKILELASLDDLPEQIDESSELPVKIVSELIDAGYLKAIDATSFDGVAFLQAKITLSGREYLNTLKISTENSSKMSDNSIRLFISHSSKDSLFVQSLIDLIRAALNLESSRIRCTSIDGYRLPGGANTSEQLKQEVHHADTFIGIISAQSINSIYVVFELGARWGANRSLIPLIAPGTNTDILKGPLKEINALSSNRSQLHQLLHQLSQELNVKLEPSASFERLIDNILNIKVSVTNKQQDKAAQNTPEMNGATEGEKIKLAIWKLDEVNYDKHGYSLELISEKAEISIPKCQLLINNLVKEKYLEEKRWSGSINGSRYLLEDKGRNYLLENNLVS
ncbi:MAG: toll/interleukin-1 receptor domain-containing protein [Pseudomonadota bacterium]